MKIAMISLYLPSASKIGVGYQAHEMANQLVRRGHRVTMFSASPRCPDALYDCVTLDLPKRFRTFSFAWRLRKVDFSPFDLIHAHGDDTWLWGPRLPPRIHTMHGSCFAEAFHVPRIKEKARMIALGILECWASVVATRSVCVSNNTKRMYPWVRRVIPNGVDVPSFRPSPSNQREADPTILFVGTFGNRKRGALLAQAFRESVKPAFPRARLWMVCSDGEASNGIEILGQISREELVNRYQRAWVFCLPSSYEGFGVPYVEALAAGTPVVATPNPGSREILNDGRYGVLCEPHDLGPQLVSLLRDAERRSAYAAEGLAQAQRYSWEKVLSEYEALYHEVAKPRL